MLYALTRPVATLALKINYRNIYLSHADRIPKGAPVILAANHPTAFIEPCILACFLDRPLYFLVRGDIFKKRFYAGILQDFNMIPVYRMKDGGYEKIKNNFESFDYCSEALAANKTLMILAEGSTQQKKQLQPLKKGTARIAFGVFEKFPDLPELYIVPVGVNYTYPNHPGSEVMINFGEPIKVRSYLETYKENTSKAISVLTEDLSGQLLKNVISIGKEEDHTLVEYLLVLCRTELDAPNLPVVKRKKINRFETEKGIADWVNGLPAEEKTALEHPVQAYFQELSWYGLTDKGLRRHSPYTFYLLGLGLLAGAPLFLSGLLSSWPPLRLARWVADRKIRFIEFFEPVRIVVALVAYLLWIPLLLLAGGLSCGIWGVAGAAVFGASGYFYALYGSWVTRWQQAAAYRRTPPLIRAKLLKHRKSLIRKLSGLIVR